MSESKLKSEIYDRKVQVSPCHYDVDQYLTQDRWASLWHQVTETLATQPNSVLVVGLGDGILSAILRAKNISTSTFDFDLDLRPDIVGDVREILDHISEKSYDVVLCCQVLEHIPYEAFESTLRALVSVARQRVILSIPYRHKRLLEVSWRFPLLPEIRTSITIPSFWREWKFDGQHYWEIGTRGFSLKKITNIVRHVAAIQKRFFATNNKYHVFFVLTPTQSNEAP